MILCCLRGPTASDIIVWRNLVFLPVSKLSKTILCCLAGLFAKALEGVSIKELVTNIGSGVGAAPAAGAPAAAAAAAPGLCFRAAKPCPLVVVCHAQVDCITLVCLCCILCCYAEIIASELHSARNLAGHDILLL